MKKHIGNRIKLAAIIFAAAFLPLFFSSCVIYDVLGIDTHDYDNEPISATHESDSDISKTLSKIVSIIVSDTTELTEFSGPRAAAGEYRDEILSFMLSDNYAKYNGNSALVNLAEEHYPQYQITTVIPGVDFESTVYKYFGGSESVGNVGTAMFTYLGDIDAYISAGFSIERPVRVVADEVSETENTYHFVFHCEIEDEKSDEYFALFMKRDDGTQYIKSLKKK